MSTDHPAPEPLVVSHDGLTRLGVEFTNQQLLNLERAGKWPKRISIGGRKTCWLMSEVKAAIAQSAEEREASSAERTRIARRGVETRRARQQQQSAA